MTFRLWFPQMDVYDTIRRMSVLIGRWQGSAPSAERVYVLDFYFANPPLLHQSNMTHPVRQHFNDLGVHRPDKLFVSYPAAPLLYKKMEPVQKEALRTITGKGLIDPDVLEKGFVKFSARGEELFESKLDALVGEDETPLVEFLVRHFGRLDEDSIVAFRRRTGLRRVGL